MDIKKLIGLLMFLGLPFLFRFLPEGLIIHEIAFWFLFLIIMLWIYSVEKRTIVSIGWKQLTVKTAFRGIGLGIVLFLLFGVIMTAVQALGLPLNQEIGQLIASQPLPFLLFIVIRAAIVEEVLYRSYAYERILELTKSKWIAAIIPVLIFMLAHLEWGVGHLIFVFFAGALFMILYISKRNLGLLMIIHFTTDVLALLVLPMLVEA